MLVVGLFGDNTFCPGTTHDSLITQQTILNLHFRKTLKTQSVELTAAQNVLLIMLKSMHVTDIQN